MAPMVMMRPETLIGVSGSWKTMPAALMVMTSLKMPQMLRVTTEERLRSANSEAIMQKARMPGKRRMLMPRRTPSAVRMEIPWMISQGPSTASARIMRQTNIIGVRKKSMANGFEVAGWRRRRIWVRPHLKPEKMEDTMMRLKPRALKDASPATIITTPMVMVPMMRMSLREGVSRRKRNAKRRTNAREEDLHIVRNVRVMNRRDIFPSPTSRDVAAPQGTSLVK